MEEYEIKTYIDNIPYLDVNEWEICRLLMYQNIQLNSKKKFELTDILSFKWDSNKSDTEISNSDIERLKQQQKLIAEQLKNNGK